jgi:hypothetical protein
MDDIESFNVIDPAELEEFEAVCPSIYADHERELLWKGWQLARSTGKHGQKAPNFCARCGKRVAGGGIHTCTPPA